MVYLRDQAEVTSISESGDICYEEWASKHSDKHRHRTIGQRHKPELGARLRDRCRNDHRTLCVLQKAPCILLIGFNSISTIVREVKLIAEYRTMMYI